MANEDIQKGTQKGRIARINSLKDFIKAEKELSIEDVYQYALSKLMVSKRVIDHYLNELLFQKCITVKEEHGLLIEGSTVKWIGEEE